MKISFTTDTYFPQPNGVAMTLKRLVEGLRARGHAVEVHRPARLASDEPGLEVGSTPIPLFPGHRLGLPGRKRLEHRWTADRPDLVYVATESPLGASAIRACKALGIPVVSGYHTHYPGYAAPYRLPFLERPAIAYLRRFHSRSDITFVPSPGLLELLSRYGYRNLRLLPRGVDASRFSPTNRDPALRSEWGVPPNGQVGLHVGRLAAEKNLAAVVRTFSEIQKRQPNFQGVFVGDGPMRVKLKRQHPEIIFTGTLSGNALARAYASADLFVFPSLTETFGNVVLEAMASGLGVVAYDYAAAHCHIETGRTGHTVPVGNEDQFVEAALALSQSSRLPEIRSQARESIKPVNWNAVIDQVEQTFRDLVEKERSISPAGEEALNPSPGLAASV